MKAGRNDPCPCGSGKKYKHCCHAKDTVPAKQQGSLPKQSEVKQLLSLFQTKRYAELENFAVELLERHPNYGFAWKLLGNARQFLKKEALPAISRAVELMPKDAEALTNLGFALVVEGRHKEATVQLTKAITIKPDDAVAYSVLGVALQCQLQHEEAIASFEKALSLGFETVELLNNLSISLTAMDRLEESVKILQKAIDLDPYDVRSYKNLAVTLIPLGDLSGAVACHQQALEFRPKDVSARNDFGVTLHALGRHVEAIQSYEIALLFDPTHEASIYNRAYAYLSLGLLKQGWVDYEHRENRYEGRHPELPFWAGEDLSNKSILIWGEQGIGDELMFASMYSEVIERAAHCVIECHAKLLPLFTRTFPGARVVVKTQPRHPDIQATIDFQCASGSLARWLRPTLESFPQQEAYVVPDPQRVQYWRDRLGQIGPGPKIGFCWRSKVNTGGRKLHYTTLDLWGPIFNTPGVHFVNLQYDQCDTELDAARAQFEVPLHSFPDLDLLNDLDEAAALTQALDLVISAGTATSVMAAALGKPTWQIQHTQGYAMLGTNYMPWFPMQRNFCRQWHQPWDEVIAEVAKLLRVAIGAEPLQEAQAHAD